MNTQKQFVYPSRNKRFLRNDNYAQTLSFRRNPTHSLPFRFVIPYESHFFKLIMQKHKNNLFILQEIKDSYGMTTMRRLCHSVGIPLVLCHSVGIPSTVCHCVGIPPVLCHSIRIPFFQTDYASIHKNNLFILQEIKDSYGMTTMRRLFLIVNSGWNKYNYYLAMINCNC